MFPGIKGSRPDMFYNEPSFGPGSMDFYGDGRFMAAKSMSGVLLIHYFFKVRVFLFNLFWQSFQRFCFAVVDVKKNVIVTVSSDKGLCGGNQFHIRQSPDKESKYVVVGEKAKAQFIRDSKNDIEVSIGELQKNPLNYTQVSVLVDDILKNVEYDALRIIFNKFQSVVAFIPTMATVLSPENVEREAASGGLLRALDSYEIEGGDTKTLFNDVLENACSEQGARMSAMESLSRNAGDMLDRLTLTYNKNNKIIVPRYDIENISSANISMEKICRS
ncbi:hypothetical protein MKW94_011493 [Papaver nudicaule]|uniref:Uncharacterized protein n=1 Tax=Papaver nudicaule TaxID=74823 RepID=A0AA41VX67_PAPNU|nr:hypothetical protein [Papaver nudicaule]